VKTLCETLSENLRENLSDNSGLSLFDLDFLDFGLFENFEIFFFCRNGEWAPAVEAAAPTTANRHRGAASDAAGCVDQRPLAS
jgi:hypothetical protein